MLEINSDLFVETDCFNEKVVTYNSSVAVNI
jgi:hypothetical protein